MSFAPFLEPLEPRRLLAVTPLLHVSPNGRYLLDANAQPFYMVGDSVWMLATNLTEAEAAQYFQKRSAEGFNAALIDAVVQADFGGPNDRSGHPPLTAPPPRTKRLA